MIFQVIPTWTSGVPKASASFSAGFSLGSLVRMVILDLKKNIGLLKYLMAETKTVVNIQNNQRKKRNLSNCSFFVALMTNNMCLSTSPPSEASRHS